MSDLARRLDLVIAQTADRQRPPTQDGRRRLWGKILTIIEGPPPTVMVEFEPGGTPFGPFHYLASTIPVVDDYVFMENVAGDLIVIGRVATDFRADQFAPRYNSRSIHYDDYELQLTDSFTFVEMDSATDVTVTVPDLEWVDNSLIEIDAVGPGQVIVAEGAGVNPIRAPHGKKSAVQYSSMQLRYRADDNEWWLNGDTTT